MITSMDRWTLTCWRRGNPRLWIASIFIAYVMFEYVYEFYGKSYYGQFPGTPILYPLAVALGYLLASIQDGEGLRLASLTYLSSRPVKRMALLGRALGIPLLLGSLLFIPFPVLREYSVMKEEYNSRVWASIISSSESWHMTRIGDPEMIERLRISGHHIVSFRDEYWDRDSGSLENEKKRIAKFEAKGNRENADFLKRLISDHELYRPWLAGKGPMPDEIKRHGVTVVLRYPLSWLVYFGWYLAFVCGVAVRAIVVFGPASGLAGGLRRFMLPRNLLPLALVGFYIWVNMGGNDTDRWDNTTGLVKIYLHTWVVVLAVCLGAMLTGWYLVRGWLCRDLLNT